MNLKIYFQFHVSDYVIGYTGRNLHERDSVHHPGGFLPRGHVVHNQNISPGLLQAGCQHQLWGETCEKLFWFQIVLPKKVSVKDIPGNLRCKMLLRTLTKLNIIFDCFAVGIFIGKWRLNFPFLISVSVFGLFQIEK